MKKNLKRLLGGVTLFLIGLIILLSPRFSVASFLVDTSNTLRTNLISYWNLNEASSTRIDSYGTNNLAVRGTGGVAAGAGKISNAADFELSEGDFLEITDNASLSTGDVDFSISAWVKLESKTTASIVTRYESGTVREYWLGYDATADRFQMYLYNSTGVNVGIATANNSGSPSTGTWYHVVAWHDSVNNTINIKVNNGTTDSIATTGAPSDTVSNTRIGAGSTTETQFFDGLIDEVGFWKKVLTTQDITDLYNSGNGNSYPNPEEIVAPPAIGSKDYCQAVTISGSNLTLGGNLTLTATANTTNIKTFSYRFYNMDNAGTAIKFKIGASTPVYTRTITKSFTGSSDTITITFPQLDRNDLAWVSPVYGNPKPKHIKVAAYFTDASNATSKNASACEVTFTAATVDPTPTPNVNCKCASNVCNATYCKFDKHTTAGTTITYATSQGCGISGVFQTAPTDDQKNAWCKRYFLTKGDANGDGKATFYDYFYYVAARFGGKVPPTVNPDFNGNNLIDDIDKEIIIKSLK